MPQAANKKVSQGEMPLSIWAAPIDNVNEANRTINIVWTAGATVRRYDWYRERYYLEQLSSDVDAVRMERLQSGKAPFLNSHNTWRLEDVLGVIEEATSPSQGGTATVRFSKREEVEPIFQDVKDKILNAVSLGARIHRIEMIPPDTEENKDWIYRAVDWEPYEVSLVSIGADPDAVVRSERQSEKQPMFGCEFTEVTRSTPPTGEAAATPNPKKGNTMTPEELAALERAAAEANETLRVARSQANVPTSPAGAVVTTQSATATAATTNDEAATTERQRVKDIRDSVRASTLDTKDVLIDGYVDRGLSIDAVRADILKRMAERSDASTVRAQGGVRIETVTDETDVRREAMMNAVTHRVNPSVVLTDAGRVYRGLTLRELCREGLEAVGISTRGMSPMQLAATALGVSERSMGTSDLPLIFGGVITRTMRSGYQAAPQTFKSWARKGTLTDFRPVTRASFDAATKFEKVGQDGEYKYGQLVEGGEVIQLATFGKVVAFTREMIINDDLSSLQRLPTFFGRSAANLESDIVYGILTGNQAMSDGKALFHADHRNVGTAAKITIDSLSAGRTAMRTQTSTGGELMNLAPKFLLVPAALETLAMQYTSNAYTPAKNTDQNVFQNQLTPISEARLDSASDKAWYLLGDNAQCDTVEYCYLDGEEGLYTEQFTAPGQDGLMVKARLDFAAKAVDFRGLWKNAGL